MGMKEARAESVFNTCSLFVEGFSSLILKNKITIAFLPWNENRAMCVKVIWKHKLAMWYYCWRKLQSSFVERRREHEGHWGVLWIELGERDGESQAGFQKKRKSS